MKQLPTEVIAKLESLGIRITEFPHETMDNIMGRSWGEWVEDDQAVIGVRKGDRGCLLAISNEMIEYSYPEVLVAMIAQRFD